MSVPVVRPSMCDRFPELQAGVSTREGGVSGRGYNLNMSFNVGDDAANVRQNRALFLHALGLREEQLAVPKQVHSDHLVLAERPGVYPASDGLLTDTPGVALMVSVADCVPILLYDPVHHACAAVHAGWRGSAARVTEQMVRRMEEAFGSAPEELVAYVGHAAGPCCYEVGEDVALQFAEDVRQRRDGRWYVDLKSENRMELCGAGLRAEQVEMSDACTVCTPSLHSYRRDKDVSGRMMAVIGLSSGRGE